MALTPQSTTLREPDGTGQPILTFLDSNSRYVQGIALVDDNSNPMGLDTNPLSVSLIDDASSQMGIDSNPLSVALIDDAAGQLGIDTNPIRTKGEDMTWYSTAAASNQEDAFHSGAGSLRELRVTNSGTEEIWALVYDAATATGTPIYRMHVPAGVEAGDSLELGIPLSTGLSVYLSVDAASQVAPVGTDCFIFAGVVV